ncbi:hypothetical protein BDN72DRAFT_865594 [Pluteus cervinus]|uniref:Uncharacterized protein n=1 Tax=Pluteus cervinus TaxID=181527 RepID=A0ACD3A0P0_9AGAR|nr:hypothetical protein BDN72DRAFT_865594 [Pluteus cervinus]
MPLRLRGTHALRVHRRASNCRAAVFFWFFAIPATSLWWDPAVATTPPTSTLPPGVLSPPPVVIVVDVVVVVVGAPLSWPVVVIISPRRRRRCWGQYSVVFFCSGLLLNITQYPMAPQTRRSTGGSAAPPPPPPSVAAAPAKYGPPATRKRRRSAADPEPVSEPEPEPEPAVKAKKAKKAKTTPVQPKRRKGARKAQPKVRNAAEREQLDAAAAAEEDPDEQTTRSDRILKEAKTTVAPPPRPNPIPSAPGPATTSTRHRRADKSLSPESDSDSDPEPEPHHSQSGSDAKSSASEVLPKSKGKAPVRGQPSEVGSHYDTDIEDKPAPKPVAAEDLAIELDGASRTEKGFSRGGAVGNVYNFGDDDEDEEVVPVPQKGKVRLWSQKAFQHVEVDSDKNSSAYIVDVSTNLGNVLAQTAEKLKSIKDNDCIIYVYDGEDWVGKGSYSTASKDPDPITWTVVNSRYSLNLIAVETLPAYAFSDALAYRATPPPRTIVGTNSTASRSVSQSVSAAAGLTSAQVAQNDREARIQLLDIDSSLTGTVLNPDLHLGYAKYVACLDAKKKFKESRGKWTGPKTTETDIISLFYGKTNWHKEILGTFSCLYGKEQFIPMVKWLEDSDATEEQTIDVWGELPEPGKSYVLSDLKRWLDDFVEKKKEKDNIPSTSRKHRRNK